MKYSNYMISTKSKDEYEECLGLIDSLGLKKVGVCKEDCKYQIVFVSESIPMVIKDKALRFAIKVEKVV